MITIGKTYFVVRKQEVLEVKFIKDSKRRDTSGWFEPTQGKRILVSFFKVFTTKEDAQKVVDIKIKSIENRKLNKKLRLEKIEKEFWKQQAKFDDLELREKEIVEVNDVIMMIDADFGVKIPQLYRPEFIEEAEELYEQIEDEGIRNTILS